MNQKVNKWPMIAVIAAAAGGVMIFSVAQFKQSRDIEGTKVQAVAIEHAKTEEVMKKIGAAAEYAAESPQERELRRLETEDRAAVTKPAPKP